MLPTVSVGQCTPPTVAGPHHTHEPTPWRAVCRRHQDRCPRDASQPGTKQSGLGAQRWCESGRPFTFSELCFFSTPSAKDGLVLALPPTWAPGTKEICAGSLGRVKLHLVQRPSLGHPYPKGTPSAVISYPAAHPRLPSVCLSIPLWGPPAPYEILAFTGRAWSQLRSGSPGASPSPGGTWLCPVLCRYKRKRRQGKEGVRDLAGVCRCPGSQRGEWWEGRGPPSFSSRARDKAP